MDAECVVAALPGRLAPHRESEHVRNAPLRVFQDGEVGAGRGEDGSRIEPEGPQPLDHGPHGAGGDVRQDHGAFSQYFWPLESIRRRTSI